MKIKRKHYILFLTIIFSLFITYFFYSKTIRNLNYAWGGGGDALQSYANSVYHIKYDTSYMYQGLFNYPFGENVFFTNCQFPITNTIKLLKNIGIDISNYTIGIINFAVLISITLSIIFLYLIFRHLKLPYRYSYLIALGIGFLSPQVHRFPGHFTLSYMFAIPFVLYILLLFYKDQKKKYSVYLGVFTFIISLLHIYYIGLIGAIILCYWFFLSLSDTRFKNAKLILTHLTLQLILPFLIIQIWGWLVDDISDRTKNPWGFFSYISCWEGIFLPLNTPFEEYFSKIFYIDRPGGEGISYVGFISAIIFVVLAFKIEIKIFKGNFIKILDITGNPVLNVFFFTALLTLFISFGFPFKQFPSLYTHIGIIRQMRGLGRFAWIFYYVMNIISFYLIYKWVYNYPIKYKTTIVSICILVLFVEAYIKNTNKEIQGYLATTDPILNDNNNDLSENKWILEIPTKNYQAILPLPYFHVGSESIWYGLDGSSISQHVLVASMKTGLPTLGVHLSRTSLSQTYKSMAVALEPYRPLEILKDFKDTRPILVIAQKDKVKETEKTLFNKCKFIKDNGPFQLYELSYSALRHISDSIGYEVKQEVESLSLPNETFYSTDSIEGFVYQSFDKLSSSKPYSGVGSISGPCDGEFVLYEGAIPNLRTQSYKMSFWFSDINKDLYARTTFKMELIKNGEVVYYDENSIFRYLQTIDKNWVLFEREFPVSDSGITSIRIKLKNEIPANDMLFADELLIRPSSVNVYKIMDKMIYKNNRFYIIP